MFERNRFFFLQIKQIKRNISQNKVLCGVIQTDSEYYGGLNGNMGHIFYSNCLHHRLVLKKYKQNIFIYLK